MRINNIYLPNWLVLLLLLMLLLVVYFTVDPVNEAVNGVLTGIFGPILEALNAASSLSVM